MAEYGLFNDEGCVEAGFYSREEALNARAMRYDPDDDLEVLEVCPDHEGQPREHCDDCKQDFDDDDCDDASEDDDG